MIHDTTILIWQKIPMRIGVNSVLKSKLLIGMCALVVIPANAQAAELVGYFHAAKQVNPQLRINQAQHVIVQNQVSVARSALLPIITVSASHNENSNDQSDVKSQAYGVSLQQGLFESGLLNRLQQSKALEQQSQLSLKLGIEQLMLSVAQAYVSIILAQSQVALAEQDVNANQQLAERSEQRYRVGKGRKVEFLQAKAAYQLSQSTLLSQKNALRSSLLQLQSLTEQPIQNIKGFEVDEVSIARTQTALNVALRQALRANLDLKQLEAAERAFEAQAQAARGTRWPKLTLSASHTNTQYDQDTVALTSGDSVAVSLNMSWTVFEGFRGLIGMDDARLQQRVSALNVKAFVIQLEQQLEQLQGRIGTALEQLPALKALVLARENEWAATQEGFAVGVSELSDVINAQNQLSRARSELHQSQLQLWLDHLQFKHVTGVMSEQDLVAHMRVPVKQ